MNEKPTSARQVMISLAIAGIVFVVGFLMTRQAQSEPAKPPESDGSKAEVSEKGKQALQIETTTIANATTEESLKAAGQVLFPPENVVTISPRLQGRVRKVLATVGDHVTAGQPLVLLDSVDGAAAQTTARQNENKLRLAKANLQREERLFKLGTPEVTQAQAALEQAKDHAAFTKDVAQRTQQQASLGGFTEKPVEDAQTAVVQAVSTLEQSRSDLAQAQKDYDRKEKLLAIGVIARSDMEGAQNVLEKARISVQANQDTLTIAQATLARERKARKANLYADQQTRQAESDYRQAQLQENAAVRALQLAQAAIRRDLEQAKSDYLAAQTDYDNSIHVLALLGAPDSDGVIAIKSPMDGVVTARNVSDGQIVDQSQMTPWQMLVISKTDVVWVQSDIYEKDIEQVKVGSPVQIRVAALAGKEFAGKIVRIAPTLDPKSRTVKAVSELPNPLGLLKDGMYAEVVLHLGRGAEQLLVPLSAIQHDGDSDYVYVEEGKAYARRQVHIASQRNGVCTLSGGLKPGERVVVHGAIFLGAHISN